MEQAPRKGPKTDKNSEIKQKRDDGGPNHRAREVARSRPFPVTHSPNLLFKPPSAFLFGTSSSSPLATFQDFLGQDQLIKIQLGNQIRICVWFFGFKLVDSHVHSINISFLFFSSFYFVCLCSCFGLYAFVEIIVVNLDCDQPCDGQLIVVDLCPLLFMLEFKIFSHAHHVFDEMLERAFIRVLVQLTYAEM